MPDITGAHHAAFTVSDLERSLAWYTDLLGLIEVFGDDTDEVSFRVLAHPTCGWIMGLRQYHGGPGDRFDEFRTGLDHFAFGVPDRATLEAWEEELRQREVPFTPIIDTPVGSVIVFRDPDNIQLEFWL
jgi:catechol 2,3-dioxygenase-like lactoylglutathione lyase family enzyme